MLNDIQLRDLAHQDTVKKREREVTSWKKM